MARKPVTLQDVAEQADVSVSTVSRVLRDEPGWIGEATAERVRKVAERLGYRRDLRARFLRTGHTDLVAVMGAHLRETVAAVMVEEITQRVADNELRAAFYSSSEDPDREISLINEFVSLRAVGIIIVSYFSPDLADALRPAVENGLAVVSLEVPIPSGIDGVAVDFQASMRLAVDHLTDLGHREIGLLTIDSGVQSVRDRTVAWQEGLRQVGMEPDDDLIEVASPSSAGGHEAAMRLLSRRPSVTAIAAMSDRLAYGALAGARDAGRRVPDDLSVTGFDDLPYSQFMYPPLSTVHIPWSDIAREGVRLLHARIDRPNRPLCIERKAGEFVSRASTAPP